MKEIKNQEFGGERPLYCEHDLYLENVIIHAGESAIKETSDITAVRCRFEGKYPFWCTDRFTVKDCIFTVGARAALWYSRDLLMEDTIHRHRPRTSILNATNPLLVEQVDLLRVLLVKVLLE